MKLLTLIILYTLSYAGISSSEKPISKKNSREPAAIGDAIIKNKDNFRVEAFGESRAKAHKIKNNKKSKRKEKKD